MNTVEYTMPELQRLGTEMLRKVAEICESKRINYCLFFGSMLGAVRHHGPIPWDYDIDIAVHENDMDFFISAMENDLPPKYWVDFRSQYDSPKCFPRIGLRGFDTVSLHIDVYRMVGFPKSVLKRKIIATYGLLLLEMRLVKNANLENYTGKKLYLIKLCRAILLPLRTSSIIDQFDKLCKRYPYDKVNSVGINGCKEGTRCIYDKKVIDDTILVDYEDFKVRIPREYDTILTSIYNDYLKFPDKDIIDQALFKKYTLHRIDM